MPRIRSQIVEYWVAGRCYRALRWWRWNGSRWVLLTEVWA